MEQKEEKQISSFLWFLFFFFFLFFLFFLSDFFSLSVFRQSHLHPPASSFRFPCEYPRKEGNGNKEEWQTVCDSSGIPLLTLPLFSSSSFPQQESSWVRFFQLNLTFSSLTVLWRDISLQQSTNFSPSVEKQWHIFNIKEEKKGEGRREGIREGHIPVMSLDCHLMLPVVSSNVFFLPFSLLCLLFPFFFASICKLFFFPDCFFCHPWGQTTLLSLEVQCISFLPAFLVSCLFFLRFRPHLAFDPLSSLLCFPSQAGLGFFIFFYRIIQREIQE